MQPGTVLRIARPTDHLAVIAEMYATGLGFTILAQFEDHDGGVGRMTVDTYGTPYLPTLLA